MKTSLLAWCRRAWLLALLGAATATSAATIAGASFEDRIRLADSDLVLNGVGLRARFKLKGYAAGLYLPAKAATAEQVLATPGPKRVQMKMMLDVNAKEFVKAINVGMQRNHSEAERLALQDRIDTFDRQVAQLGKLRKGDIINLDFIPGRGLMLVVNGRPSGAPVEGEDFYAGVLRIFLGERPVDKNLKAGLLGAAPP